jgi:subtilisin family serine protease
MRNLFSITLFIVFLATIATAEQFKLKSYELMNVYPQLPPIAHGEKRPSYHHVKSAIDESWAWEAIGLNKGKRLPVTFPCQNTVVVAVIDTGIDYTHTMLSSQVWLNQGELGKTCTATSCSDKAANGLDDDGNGFVDDVAGWDFVHDWNTPYDTHGHGTHVSGIITYIAHEGLGAQPQCPDVVIMPLKYYDSSGLGYNNLNNTIRAIHYATKMGADIINYSSGGTEPSPLEKQAIEEARDKGILFVAAAGNDGHQNEVVPYYPASYGLDNIISVAGHNPEMTLVPSSNFGLSVDVAAPGLMVLSTLPENRVGSMSGTSQACAIVTGIAAVLTKRIGHRDYRKVKAAILKGTLPMGGHPMLSHGRVYLPDAIRALKEK